MSLRPLELAQNILNQAQQAQQKLGESAADRVRTAQGLEQQQSDALKKLQQVAKEREVQGHQEGDEASDGRKQHAQGSDTAPEKNSAAPESEFPHHADETPEGKGRTLDIDV